MEAATALSTLQLENKKLRDELERMKKIMREHGIMVIPSKYPGVRSEWNIPKPRGRRKTDMKRHTKPSRKKDMMKLMNAPMTRGHTECWLRLYAVEDILGDEYDLE